MADEEQTPAPYKHQATPGPLTKGLSSALMASAFEKFGKAFTQTGDVRRDSMNEGARMAPWREQGQKVTSALEERWHTMEFENFEAQAIEPYIQAKREMLGQYKQRHAQLDAGIKGFGPNGEEMYVDIKTPEGREELIRLRGQLEKDFYGKNGDMDLELFAFAHKYPTNPKISKRIERISTEYSNQLNKTTNPDQTLAAENNQSIITARMMDAHTNQRNSRANLKNANRAAIKDPKNLKQAAKHEDYGPGGGMEFLTQTKEGKDIMYGSAGAGAYENAVLAFKQDLIRKDSALADQPQKLKDLLTENEGRIRNMAASEFLKRNSPAMYKAAKEQTPWYWDFEASPSSGTDGELGEEDERGWKGENRVTKPKQKQLAKDWEKPFDKELDKWASDMSNELTEEAAMDHMEQWLRNAIVNGGTGISASITIAPIDATREVRAQLMATLLERGVRYLYRNAHFKEAQSVGSKLLGGLKGAGSPRFRRRKRGLLHEKRKQSLLDEGT